MTRFSSTTRSIRGRSGSSIVVAGEEDEIHLRPLGARSEAGDHLFGIGQRERPAERDDLTPGLELAEKEHVVDQLPRLLHLQARLLDELVDVGVRKRRASRAGRASARAASAARARPRR